MQSNHYRRYEYHSPEEPTRIVGFYELNPLPGCNQVVVSNHAWINPAERGKGWGDLAHKERLDRAGNLGYDYILCTVISTNNVQKHILVKAGWRCLDTFRNRETGHQVEVWGRRLCS